MKTYTLLFAVACLGVMTPRAFAQMSTFPSPPSLEPVSPGPSASAQPSAPANLNPPADGKPDTAVAPASKSTAQLTAATLTSMAALDDKVALEAGDSISFRVIEDRDDPVTRLVTDTGEIDFPYIGRVKVEGKTCHQVANEVKKLLEVDYYKRATVIVGLDLIIGTDKTKAKDMAWIAGEVKFVGPLELTKSQRMTVSQLILRAGGFGDFADQRRIKVIHRSPNADPSKPADIGNIKDAQVIDVKAILDGKSASDPVIKPGDYVIVPKRIFNGL